MPKKAPQPNPVKAVPVGTRHAPFRRLEGLFVFDTSRNQDVIKDPLIRPLWEDMVESERMLEQADSQFSRRAYFRAAFAFIEGNLFWLKGVALRGVIAETAETAKTGDLRLHRITALLDDTPRVERTGKIKLDPNRLPFLNQVALVLRTCADLVGLDASSFFGDAGWAHLHRSLEVRHKITHPKTPKDLAITDAQMDSLRRGLTWFYGCLVDIANRMAETPYGRVMRVLPARWSRPSPKEPSGQ